MPDLLFSNYFEYPANELYQWHLRPGALERLIPPWLHLQVNPRLTAIFNGARKTLKNKCPPFTWVAHHQEFDDGKSFVDVQLQGPFKKWRHHHVFVAKKNATTLEDRISFEHSFKTALAWPLWLKNNLARTFHFRTQRLLHDLYLQHLYPLKKLKIVISGASGLVGSALHAFLLTAGHEVFTLVRRNPRAGTSEIFWNPYNQEIDLAALEGMDVMIHLSGENIANHLWTKKFKQKLAASRIQSTEFLIQSIKQLKQKPKTFLCASAIGWYGNSQENWVDESNTAGDGFLPELCKKWEAASDLIRHENIRLVQLRIGIVLSSQGGMLAKILPSFKAGLGAILGNGQQYLSWIALDDLIGIIYFSIANEKIQGPINCVSPNPVTNQQFSKILAKKLHRPLLLKAPTKLITTLLGEMGQSALLASTRVKPQLLLKNNYPFLFQQLDACLDFELGIPRLTTHKK